MELHTKNNFYFSGCIEELHAFVRKKWSIHQNHTFVKSVTQKSLNYNTTIRFRFQENSFGAINHEMHGIAYEK